MSKELRDEITEFIAMEVRSGFYHKDEILKFTLDAYSEDDPDEKWIMKILTDLWDTHMNEAATWEHPTDFDKLAEIFDELNKEHIIALHWAGYTKQDGYNDVQQVLTEVEKKGVHPKGFCFYHTQDLQRALSLGLLLLAFDDMEGDDARAVALGQHIVSKFHRLNFETEWDGTVEQRIAIKKFKWQKIVDDEDWGPGRAIACLTGEC